MARLEEYRVCVKRVLEKYSSHKPAYGDVEIQVISDTEHGHYQLVSVGWHNQQRVYGCVLHIDIKDDKIWIQHDGTEIGIANELVALGIPREDIVLGFHAPYKRQFAGFSAN